MALLKTIQLVFGVIMLYQLGIYLAGIFYRRESVSYTPLHRFALVVPAHNEEIVIGCLVRSLKHLDYPSDLYDIYVICDNCTDSTEDAVVKAGGTPWRRVDQEKRGKQWALGWAFERILDIGKHDAVCVFDADNLVAPDFLTVMNDRLCRGEKVIQGYLDTKNPDDTWITRAYAISYWGMNRVSQLARSNLGLPVYLGGTGFCVSIDVLKKYGWHVTTLTDDLEYSVQMVLAGIKPTLAYDARVWDEKPLTLRASMRQRLRWMQGQADVAFKYTLPLLWKLIRTGRLVLLDTLLYVYLPLVILVNQAFILTATLGVILSSTPAVQAAILARSLAFQMAFSLVPMVIQRIPVRHYRGLLLQPLYNITWLPLIIAGILRRNHKAWAHTKHVRAY